LFAAREKNKFPAPQSDEIGLHPITVKQYWRDGCSHTCHFLSDDL
jgi:hypothetical protein